MSIDSKLYVLRFTGSTINEAKLLKIVFGSLRTTQYQYIVDNARAPSTTNCVTAIRYLQKKSFPLALPSIFIGDMPRVLMTQCGYALHHIKLQEIKCGDLIFFKRKTDPSTDFYKRYICHIAIGIGPSMIFHSAQERGGGSIENLAYPADQYAQTLFRRVIDQPFLFLRYIDPRNQKLRSQFEAEFLPFAIPLALKMPLEFFQLCDDKKSHRGKQIRLQRYLTT